MQDAWHLRPRRLTAWVYLLQNVQQLNGWEKVSGTRTDSAWTSDSDEKGIKQELVGHGRAQDLRVVDHVSSKAELQVTTLTRELLSERTCQVVGCYSPCGKLTYSPARRKKFPVQSSMFEADID